MEDKKRLRVCFTGHRPEKLYIPESAVKDKLQRAIEQAIDDGYKSFITGMARGVDIWAAEVVLEKRKKHDIKLVCYSPFEGFEKSWNFFDKRKYNEIMEKADYTTFVCNSYSKSCFQIRNCAMVDVSSRIIAAFNGKSGGTKNTINYAIQKGVEVINILE